MKRYFFVVGFIVSGYAAEKRVVAFEDPTRPPQAQQEREPLLRRDITLQMGDGENWQEMYEVLDDSAGGDPIQSGWCDVPKRCYKKICSCDTYSDSCCICGITCAPVIGIGCLTFVLWALGKMHVD